jgi:putative transposase
MTNHLHILCTPQCTNGVNNTMQYIGSQYLRYFNYIFKRSDKLWEGRYKLCLVEDRHYQSMGSALLILLAGFTDME